MRVYSFAAVIAATLVGLGPTVHADDENPDAPRTLAVSEHSVGSVRSQAKDWMVPPKGTVTIGGSLRFLTAEVGLGENPLRFTDIVMLSVDTRYSIAGRVELFGGVDFLPKQPSFTDELIWQSAAAGARIGFGKRYAIDASVGAGMLLADQGMWGASGLGVVARKSLHETLVLTGGLGSSFTALSEEDRDTVSWLVEVVPHGAMTFRTPRGEMAGWVGTEFRVPVAHDSSESRVSGLAYDPQTRVNFNVGFVLSYIDTWDIYAKYSFVDRGDAVAPETTLPILDGGFDQTQLIIGLVRRFEADDDDDHAYIAY